MYDGEWQVDGPGDDYYPGSDDDDRIMVLVGNNVGEIVGWIDNPEWPEIALVLLLGSAEPIEVELSELERL